MLYPNSHLHAVGEETARHDIAECRDVAKSAGASGRSGKGTTMAGRTAVGAGAGAASGAVGGAIAGSPATGAAIGAATGATGGLLSGIFSSSQPDPTYVNIVTRCLSERGYEVAGWK